jgi:hypothetical protein
VAFHTGIEQYESRFETHAFLGEAEGTRRSADAGASERDCTGRSGCRWIRFDVEKPDAR